MIIIKYIKNHRKNKYENKNPKQWSLTKVS